MAFTFEQLGSDNFTPDANPVNPSLWIPSTNTDSFGPLQAVSGTARVTATDIDCAAFYIATPTPVNGYAQVTIAGFDQTNLDAPGFEFFFRSSVDCMNQYSPFMGSNGDGTAFGGIAILVDGVETDFATFDSIPFSVGDVWKAWIYGNTLYMSQNGTVIAQYTDTNNTFPSAGYIGFDISSLDALTTVELSSFSMGVVLNGDEPYSVPDDRDTAEWPNAAVDVQDTLQYTGLSTSQTSYKLPVDSRKAGAPVDSRVASIIPLNSRTPGTYGPGE